MTRRVHELNEAFHFGDLTGDRVVMEAMTNFDAGTQLDEVLQYIHRRLTLLEQGDHNVGAFRLEAFTLIPSFTIDAVAFEHFDKTFTMDARTPVSSVEASFTVGAALMPQFSISAVIQAQGPIETWHQDYFTNEWLDSWGTPSEVGEAYTYNNDAHEDASDKLELTQDVTDPDFPDHVGRYVEEDQTYYTHSARDDGLANKTVTFLIDNGRGIDGYNIIRFEFRGSDNYLSYRIAGIGAPFDSDLLTLVIDGVSRDSFGSPPGMGDKWAGPKYFQIQAVEGHVRARVWGIDDAQPDWQLEYRDALTTTGPTAINWRGTSFVIVILHPNGRPWTHDMKEWTVESRGGGRLLTGAFIQPYFTMDAVIIRGGVYRLDAFIQPYFNINARIVIRQLGSFVMDAVIPLSVTGNPTIDAFIQPYFTMDAWFFAPVQTGDFTVDASLVSNVEASVTANAVVERNIPVSFTADAITEAQIGPFTYSLDAWIAYGGTYSIDAYVSDTRFLIDAIFQIEQTASIPIDSRILNPELLREFFIYAYIPPPIVTFTTDAIILKDYDHIVHQDDFDNRVTTANLGVPSHRGRYTYSANAAKHTVSAGVWQHSDTPNVNDIAMLADVSGNVDREVYWEMNYEPNSGTRIGDYYLQLAGSLRFRIHALNNSAWIVQYAGGDTSFSLTPGTSNWIGMHAVIYNNGKKLKWKLWPRDDGEPELWEQWIDMEAEGWTITDDLPSWNADSDSWFGQGDPPFDHDHDNLLVTLPTGAPFVHEADAIFQATQTDVFTVDALQVPVPFTADAFVQPYFTTNARIWLGTTFSTDAIIEAPQLFLDSAITHDHKNGGGATSWTHTPPANAKTLIVTSHGGTSATYGNKAMTSLGTETFYLTDITGRDDDVVRMDIANSYSWSTFLISLEEIDYSGNSSTAFALATIADTIPGNAHRAIYTRMAGSKLNPLWGSGTTAYQGDGVGYLLSFYWLNNPVSGFKRGSILNIDGSDTTDLTGGVVTTQEWTSHTAWLFQAASSFTMDAILSKAFTMDAWLSKTITPTPFTADAWFHEEQTASLTVDAVVFDFGEQLRDFTIDAWLVPPVEEVRPTQFGWLEPGWMMWADVFVERALRQFNANALINAFDITNAWTIDAVMSLIFEANAIKQDTFTFGADYVPGYTHVTHGPTTGTLDWTHTPQNLGRTLFVHVSNNDDTASAVTYGGISLTRRRNMVIFNRRNEIWVLEDISARANDTISIAGIGSMNTYATSTIIDSPIPFVYQAGAGPSSWVAWGGTNNFTFGYADSITPAAYRVVLSVAGGEGSDYSDQGVVAYDEASPHDSYYLSDALTAGSNGTAVVLTIDGPDTGSTTAGFSTTGQSAGTRYQGGVLLAAVPAPNPDTGMTVNAVISA